MTPAEQLDAHVRNMMSWHFSPETGCPFWLDWAARAGWEPRREIKTFADINRFPHFQDEWLRDEQNERFVPKGFGDRPFNIFETGGTTGVPKQRIGWDDYKVDYEEFGDNLNDEFFPRGGKWLMMGPTGPRRLRLSIEHLANYRGGSCYFVDLDPRWVKKLIARKQFDEVERYMKHVVDQGVEMIKHRGVQCLFTTPRLLEALGERISIPGLGVKGVFCGGTSMTPQMVRFLMEEVLEGKAQFVPTYGNTLMGLACSRPDTLRAENYSVTYWSPQPRAVLRVVNSKETDKIVEYGEYGRVELTTMTKEFFMPRFLERDEAIRRGPCEKYPWDGVRDVRPFGAMEKKVIEGVYLSRRRGAQLFRTGIEIAAMEGSSLPAPPLYPMQRFSCQCGHVLFFGSFQCLSCQREVGYDPQRGLMPPAVNTMKRCDNGLRHSVCNWLLPADASHTLCIACRLNRTIPDLETERNRMLWGRMEMAKRRLIYTLLRLGIPVLSRAENARSGLAFDIISTVANPEVTTGHLNGVITVNLEEADDTYRQFSRQQLGESSRTLLGHFRHESAHYFWQRFLSDLMWDDPLRLAFRERFGDEWLDYGTSLNAHYQNGAPAGWEQNFITAYAASHPWEDWAETWAHYLQITDALETCEALGMQVQHLTLPLVMLPGSAGTLPSMLPQSGHADGAFLASIQRWMCLSTVLNEIAHSLGEPPLYPFVIPTRVAQKLRLAHHFASVWAK